MDGSKQSLTVPLSMSVRQPVWISILEEVHPMVLLTKQANRKFNYDIFHAIWEKLLKLILEWWKMKDKDYPGSFKGDWK